MTEIEEAQQAVYNIAYDIYESTGGVEYFDLSLSHNGWCTVIDFIGIRIWSSEDDDRLYINEDNDDREPLEQYIRRMIMIELAKLSNINLNIGI